MAVGRFLATTAHVTGNDFDTGGPLVAINGSYAKRSLGVLVVSYSKASAKKSPIKLGK